MKREKSILRESFCISKLIILLRDASVSVNSILSNVDDAVVAADSSNQFFQCVVQLECCLEGALTKDQDVLPEKEIQNKVVPSDV